MNSIFFIEQTDEKIQITLITNKILFNQNNLNGMIKNNIFLFFAVSTVPNIYLNSVW